MNRQVSGSIPQATWHERPLRELMRLSWPTMLSLISVSTMTLVDSIFLGHLGATELAAAGLGGVTMFAVLSFGIAVFGAAKVDVGLHYGAGNDCAVKRSLAAFIRLALILGVASTVVGLIAAWSLEPIAQDRVIGTEARTYASMRALGLTFELISVAIAGFRQAQGDSKSAMGAAFVANLTNIPLNYLLLFVWRWGVFGAALSTVLSALLEAVWLVVLQIRGTRSGGAAAIAPGLHLDSGSLADARHAFFVGLPTGLERVLDMIAFAAVPMMLARLGPLPVAAHQVVLQIMMFSFLPLTAFNESVAVLVSQALGAKETRLVPTIQRLGMRCALGYGALCAAVCLLVPGSLMQLFSTDQALIALGAQTLAIASFLQFENAAYNLYKGVLRGLSDFRFVAWTTVGCAWTITPPLTYLLGVRAGFGVKGAWSVLSLEVAIGTVIMYFRTKQRLRAVTQAAG